MKKYLFLLIFFPPYLYSQADSLRDLLNFYPLQPGNYWEYKTISQQLPYPTDSSAYSVEVKGDTLLDNNKTYKILMFKGIYRTNYIYYNYERIDSLSGCIYRYKKDTSFTNNEYKIDSLYAQSGDTINSSREGFTGQGYFQTICSSIASTTILGIATQVKTFYDLSYIGGEYSLAKGFGYYSNTSCEFNCWSTYMVYAKISGIEYGNKIITSVTKNKITSGSYQLYQNYPNPFNPTTVISYSIPKENIVTIKVFDILGNEVASLVNEEKPAGKYSVNFNASKLSSGIYFYRMQAGNFVEAKKLILLK